MRTAVALWRWLERKDHTVRVAWESDRCLSVRVYHPCRNGKGSAMLAWELLIHRKQEEDLFQLLDKKRTDLGVAARAALLIKVNEKLSGGTSPCLLLDREGLAAQG